METRSNPVFWLMWMLPAATVVAGLSTVVIAMRSADRALPEEYHWEGERLDRDFERQRLAVALGIEVTLEAANGHCVATVRGGSAEDSLNLLLTHGSDASLDRRVLLRRDAAETYRGDCDVPPARWRIAIDSPASGWSVRARHEGGIGRVTLRARPPEGPAA